MWHLLTIIATILLVVYWRGPNAVWGGAIAGLLVGIILKFLNVGNGWQIVEVSFSIGVALGLAADLLGRFSDRMRG